MSKTTINSKSLFIPAALFLVSIAPTRAAIVFNVFYDHFNPSSSLEKDGLDEANDDIASWAYDSNGADAFGGIATFSTDTNDTFDLASGGVLMSNWAGSGTNTATASYQHDFTLELYSIDRSGTDPVPDSLLGSFTETQEVAGRQIPTTSNQSFAGNGTDFIMDFDLNGLSVPNEVIYMLSFVIPVGDPNETDLESLNIAAVATGTAPDATSGIVQSGDEDQVYWRSTSTGGNIEGFSAGPTMSRFAIVPEPSSFALLTGLALLFPTVLRRAPRGTR